jgi:hypothetical protein
MADAEFAPGCGKVASMNKTIYWSIGGVAILLAIEATLRAVHYSSNEFVK